MEAEGLALRQLPRKGEAARTPSDEARLKMRTVRGFTLACLFSVRRTADSELVRTRGIRLFN